MPDREPTRFFYVDNLGDPAVEGDAPEEFHRKPNGYDGPIDTGANPPPPIEQEDPIIPIRSKTVAELATEPDVPRRFLDVRERFPMRNVVLLSGDGGTGKSLLALQLAIAVSCGKQWLGSDINEAGSVVYIAAEDEEREVRQRITQICENMSIDPLQVRNLHIVSLAEEDDSTFAVEGRGTLRKTKLFQRVEARLDQINDCRVVFLDNVADCYGANENVRYLVKTFVSMWRVNAIKRDCVVILLHHPSEAGIRDGTGKSGSTAWHNSVKSRLYLERVKGEGDSEADPDRRVLKNKKANYSRIGEDIHLRYNNGQFDLTEIEKPFDIVRQEHVVRVRAEFRKQTHKANSQSLQWGGYWVADMLGLQVGKGIKAGALSTEEADNRRRIERILAQWVRNEVISIIMKKDEQRHMKEYFSVPGTPLEEPELGVAAPS